MRKIITAAIAIAASSIFNHSPAVANTNKGTKSSPKPWIPASFNTALTKLPPGYQGVDQKKFWEHFTSRVESLKKGEFETSEEFAKRVSDADALLSPINTKTLYAFKIDEVRPKYNADSQTYEFGGLVRDLYSCSESGIIGGIKHTLVCRTSVVYVVQDKYTGSNAYGATRVVTRTRGRYFGVAIPADHDVFSTNTQRKIYSSDYPLLDKLEVPVEKAKIIKNEIGILLVGNVSKAEIVDGESVSVSPQIDRPRDIFFSTQAVPLELKRVIYYVVPTGEILGQRIFTNSEDQ